jgi:protease-4
MDPNSQSQGPQEPPLATPVAYEASSPPRKRTRPSVRWLLVLLALGLLGSLLLNVILFGVAGFVSLASFDRDRKLQEEFHSYRKTGRNKVAILSVKGAIISGEGFVKRQIDQARADPDVKAVVLRVDSPGGTVSGSDYIYHHLCELAKEKRIPIVVSMGGLAASGGYYVSMAVGETPRTIFAEPTTWTGSIGVMIPHYDLSKLLENWGIEEDTVASHRLKTMGSFTKKMTEEERRIFQALVEEGFAQFKDVVQSGRPKFRNDPETLDKLATGQVYTAQQALDNSLIDKIGFVEDAIERAIELANLDKDDVRVVEYKRAPNLADVLLGGQVRSRQLDLAAMLEMTAPRAYYLCTRLPPLTSSP